MKKLILILFVTYCSLFAQKEANIWYFGNMAGLDFNSGIPVALTDGALNTLEGLASISDSNGMLLFYTDGITVWNKQHKIMSNGTGLLGNISATQSAIIVPAPLSTTLYYIFTVPDIISTSGLNYSIVDIERNGGLGAVTLKNQSLYNATICEKVTAVMHSNNIDIWVIIHEWNSNRYFAYLVTQTGIIADPVISSAGLTHAGDLWNAIGYLKASPDRKKIANVMYRMTSFEILDFHNTTGVISNPITLTDPDYFGFYGLEFSSDGKFLYIGKHFSPSKIFQFDITSNNQAEILNSQYLLSESGNIQYGALQIGPDGKIYISKEDETNLSVINNPNSKGSACNFSYSGADLLGRNTRLGLPSFIQSFFDYTPEVSSNSPVCIGQEIMLKCETIEDAVYIWTGPAGFNSNDINPIISPVTKANEGTYTVTIYERTGRVLIAHIDIQIYEAQGEFSPQSLVDIGNVCIGSSTSISFSFENTGQIPFVISSVGLLLNGGSYGVDIGNVVGTEIQVGSKMEFILKFEPTKPGPFIDSLIIETTNPCPMKYAIELTGYGVYPEIGFSIPDTSAEIGDYICIPVHASLYCANEFLFDLDYKTALSLQGDVFLINEVLGADLISNSIANRIQTITIAGNTGSIDNESRIIAHICGKVMLGELDSTSISFSEIILINNNFKYKATNGSIKTGEVCADNLTRFRSFKPLDITLYKNPVKEAADIKLTLPQKGNYQLMIYDYYGNSVINELIQSPEDSFEIEIRINLTNYLNGLYMAVIKGPTEISTAKFIKL